MSDIQQAVRDKYGAIAASVRDTSAKPECCGPRACGGADPITSNLYSDSEAGSLPADAVAASLGCGSRAWSAAGTRSDPRLRIAGTTNEARNAASVRTAAASKALA